MQGYRQFSDSFKCHHEAWEEIWDTRMPVRNPDRMCDGLRTYDGYMSMPDKMSYALERDDSEPLKRAGNSAQVKLKLVPVGVQSRRERVPRPFDIPVYL